MNGLGKAPCHTSVVLSPRLVSEIPSNPIEAAYIAGLQAVAHNDPHEALASLRNVVDQDVAASYDSARLLVSLLRLELGDLHSFAAETHQVSDQGPDAIARSEIVASRLYLAPASGSPKVVLSSFLDHPRLSLRLAALGSFITEADWLAAVEILDDIGSLLASERADVNPLLAFAGGISPSGDPFVDDLTDLSMLLLSDVSEADDRDSYTPAIAPSGPQFIHALLSLLLSVLGPEQMRLVLVDIKRAELTPYEGLPHLAGEIADNTDTAINQLRGLIENMQTRYQLMQSLGVQDLKECNARLATAGHEPLPRVLCVAQDLADLVLTSRKQVETLLARLLREGPLAGVHLIFTTRTTSDLIALPVANQFSRGRIPATLVGLRHLTCWTQLRAGHPDQVLTFLDKSGVSSDIDQSKRQALTRLGTVGRLLTLARNSADDPVYLYKAAALAANGLTDAALLVYDDAIRRGDQSADPGRHAARYAKAELLANTGDLGGARRELARLYADRPSWDDYLGLLNRVRPSAERPSRAPIPEDVRHAVWRRDEGRCVQCGSQEDLEFDHIIPFSRGGSNTERNLQLLCAPCNRRKAATI
jgi:FtsK/SpoIIIE family/HNH endonuclease